MYVFLFITFLTLFAVASIYLSSFEAIFWGITIQYFIEKENYSESCITLLSTHSQYKSNGYTGAELCVLVCSNLSYLQISALDLHMHTH
jgi:hypothetical protein